MVDQIYYKVQYPLKKAIDLMKDLDKYELSFLREDLNSYEKEKINSLISDLRDQQ